LFSLSLSFKFLQFSYSLIISGTEFFSQFSSLHDYIFSSLFVITVTRVSINLLAGNEIHSLASFFSVFSFLKKKKMAPKFEWWAKGNNNNTRKGTPVVVKMENPNNWSMVELESPSHDDFLVRTHEKSRNKNARQLTWVLLLKAHRAAGCLTSLGSALFALGTAVRRRIAAGRTDIEISSSGVGSLQKQNHTKKSKLFYSCLKVFLWLSLILLGFEIAAYFKGWSFGTSKLQLQFIFNKGFFDWVYTRWVLLRVEYLAPPLQFLANGCIVLFLVQSLDRLILCLGCFWIRFKKIKPVPKPDSISDLESGDNGAFLPMVLVQIPMCNEKEVTTKNPKAKTNFELVTNFY